MAAGFFYLYYFYTGGLANLSLDSGKIALNYSHEAIHDIRVFAFLLLHWESGKPAPGVWKTCPQL